MPAARLRTCKLIRDDESGADILAITQSRIVRGVEVKSRDFYRVENNPNARWAFRLHKLVHEGEDPTVYDVLIDGDNSSCDCIGFTQYGRPCKHITSVSALIEARKLS